jgi:glycosyltransferase 2 family protein
MKRRLLAGVAVAVLCLYFALRGISAKSILLAFLHAQPRWILAAVVVYLLASVFRSLRWRLLLAPLTKGSFLQILHLLVIGVLANNILPFRIGELVRADLTGRKLKISRSGSLGTIFVERLLDMVAFLTTFSVSALLFVFPPKVKMAAKLLGGCCLLALLGLVAMIQRGEWVEALLQISPVPVRLRSGLLRVVQNFTHGVSGVVKMSSAIPATALSMVVWVGEGTVIFFLAHAFSLSLSYPQAFYVLFFMGLAVTLPQAPGYVGTMELFGVTALQSLGFTKEAGLPVILGIHGFQFLFFLVLGLWGLWEEGLNLKTLTQLSQRDTAETLPS